MRMPRLAAGVLFLALVALSSSITYAGYLVVGIVSETLGIGRILAGLLLGCVFARVPWIRQGRLRTVGLLPKTTRRPVMAALLLSCLATYLYRDDLLPTLFLAFAASFLLVYPRIRKALVQRALASFFGQARGPTPPGTADRSVIDVEFREKKE